MVTDKAHSASELCLFAVVLDFLLSVSAYNPLEADVMELPRMDIHGTHHRSGGTLPTLQFSEVTVYSREIFCLSPSYYFSRNYLFAHSSPTSAECPLLHDRPIQNPRPSTLQLSGKSLFRRWMCLTCCNIFSPWLTFLGRSFIHDALKITIESQL